MVIRYARVPCIGTNDVPDMVVTAFELNVPLNGSLSPVGFAPEPLGNGQVGTLPYAEERVKIAA
jgi:hypothetical protein